MTRLWNITALSGLCFALGCGGAEDDADDESTEAAGEALSSTPPNPNNNEVYCWSRNGYGNQQCRAPLGGTLTVTNVELVSQQSKKKCVQDQTWMHYLDFGAATLVNVRRGCRGLFRFTYGEPHKGPTAIIGFGYNTLYVSMLRGMKDSQIYYNQVSTAGGSFNGRGPIGSTVGSSTIASDKGSFYGEFSTVEWPKGAYDFSLYTTDRNGLRNSPDSSPVHVEVR